MLNIKFNKAFFIPVIILLLIFLVTLFFLKPKIASIAKNKKELATQKKILAELTKKLSALEGLSKTELADKVVLSLKVLPPEKDVASAIFVLKKLALDNGLNIGSLTIPEVGEIATFSAETKKTEKKEILPSLVIKFNILEGEGIINFLRGLETTAPLMKIKGLKISQGVASAETEIEVNYYFLPLPKTLGKIEQALNPITPTEEKAFEKIKDFILLETVESQESTPSASKENLFSY